MRQFLIAAAALAVGGLAASTAANAQPSSMPYVAGGPVKVGNMCIVNTDPDVNDSYGYYEPCGKQAVASAPRRKR